MNSISFTSQHRKLAEGMGADAEFWRIAIDGTELTTAARPFNASESEIVLHECEECYCCGQPEVLVRKYDAQTVIWFAKTTEHDNNKIPDGSFYLFDAGAYDDLLNGTSSELRGIEQDDFEHLLPWYTPHDPAEALYTEPQLPRDEFGKRTLKKLDDSFRFGKFISANPPDKFGTLKIGLDRPAYPELVIKFGMVNGTIAFQFVQNPHIPVWIKVANNPNPFIDIFKIEQLAG